MRVLYFDCFSGISGDMSLGALLDLGIDQEQFRRELAKLNIKGYSVHIDRRDKQGIMGTDVTVLINDEYEEMVKRLEIHGDKSTGHHHTSYPLYHDHSSLHNQDHAEEEKRVEMGQPELENIKGPSIHDMEDLFTTRRERNLQDILSLIDHSDLKGNVKAFAKMVFDEIARAEARVHNKPIDQIHFHEVGAIDSIVDIVGVAICLDILKVKRVYASPLRDGQGFIECAHGKLPVPVPAVMEMLKGSGIPYITEDVNTEMVTPTGLGIIKSLAMGFGRMPAMMIDKVGYGFGKRETGRLNALRVVLGDTFDEDMLMEESFEDLFRDKAMVLETNLDDMSPQLLGYCMEKLFGAGALDVYYTPVYMKKNRPAVKLSVILKPQDEEKISRILFSETTTLGIRRFLVARTVMERECKEVNTPFGNVRFKIGKAGSFTKASPEYEDISTIAREQNLPLREVFNTVNRSLSS